VANSDESGVVVCVVGGAVAGSEAAKMCVERGARVVVVDQGTRPYGKIEDGLPRWHEKLRLKEYAKIDENLASDGIRFVPCTEVGKDVAFTKLVDLGFSAILLANGAWRDRPLPIDGIDTFEDRGFVYQNAFVHWFNHADDPGYDGPRYEVPEGAVVVGGGLASIDVAKILSLETHARALRAKGYDVTVVDLEHRGIPAWCEKHDVELAALDVKPPTLFYRRTMEDMPLASPPPNATDAQRAKVKKARAKIMNRVIDRYLVGFEPLHVPSAPIVDGDRLVGLVFQRTEIVDGRVKPIEGSETEVRTPLVISSIGSVPRGIAGIPMRGELYDFEDWETGALRGLPNVFGLGNVLTGKGNIRDSRQNALEITEQMLDVLHEKVRDCARATVEKALDGPKSSPDAQAAITAWVEERWEAIGYESYETWIEKHR